MIMGHMSDTKVGDRVEIIRCYDAYTKLKRGKADEPISAPKQAPFPHPSCLA
jgi:hypothetical protein